MFLHTVYTTFLLKIYWLSIGFEKLYAWLCVSGKDRSAGTLMSDVLHT